MDVYNHFIPNSMNILTHTHIVSLVYANGIKNHKF